MFFFPQSLNEEILSRKKTVDQAIKNGQALLKQTTGNNQIFNPLFPPDVKITGPE